MGCTSVDAGCQEAGISAGDGVRTSSSRCWMPSQTTSSHLDLGRIFQQRRRPGVGRCVCVCVCVCVCGVCGWCFCALEGCRWTSMARMTRPRRRLPTRQAVLCLWSELARRIAARWRRPPAGFRGPHLRSEGGQHQRRQRTAGGAGDRGPHR